jgi:hypothetical protein
MNDRYQRMVAVLQVNGKREPTQKATPARSECFVSSIIESPISPPNPRSNEIQEY